MKRIWIQIIIGNYGDCFLWHNPVMGRVRDLELAAVGITPEQSGALFLLSRRGKSTIGEMAKAWCRQRNSVSTLMDRMAKQGFSHLSNS